MTKHLTPVFVASSLAALALAAFAASGASADAAPSADDGRKAFADVAKVLQSPRCQNCHPKGDAPMVGDNGDKHPMEVRRGLERVGMSCQTCHALTPTSLTDKAGVPPANAIWMLPPAEHPMVFEGKSQHDLCVGVKDPKQNGGKDGKALLHHVSEDALVLHGWTPGGARTKPPLAHDAFVAQFATWVNAGMPCP